MLKGHVRLDLKDPITGKVKERIEGENTFTDAINSFINKCPMGADRQHLYASSNYTSTEVAHNFTQTALGGILLFPDVVEGVDTSTNPYTVDTSVLYESWEHEPTGYARYGAQDTDDRKTGTFNGVLSGKIENGYKFVYDFATSQANGTIRSICLTHKYGGEAYGKKNMFLGTKYSLGLIASGSGAYYLLGFHGRYAYFINNKNKFTTGTNIYKLELPRMEMLIDQVDYNIANAEVIYTNDVGDARICLSEADAKIYIISNGGSSSEKVLTTIDLTDPETPTTSTLSFDAQSGITDAIDQMFVFAKRGNYMYIVVSSGTEDTVLKFNPNNMAQWNLLDAPTNAGGGACNMYYMADNGDISATSFVIDIADGIHAVTLPIPSNPFTPGPRVGVWQAYSHAPQGSGDAGRTPLVWALNPTYLASKFVLESPVEKSVALAAQIEYRVTHV